MADSSTTSSDAWLAQARRGDGRALGLLLQRYRAYLHLLARSQIGPSLRGKVDASDAVQETFLKASGHFAQFSGVSEPQLAAWLREILATSLANLARRYQGTQRRDVRRERQWVEGLERSSKVLDRGLLGSRSTPSQLVSRHEQAVLVADAVVALPEASQEIIILRHLQELSFPEIARRTGRSLDSVKNLWIRGLRRLRKTLEESP